VEKKDTVCGIEDIFQKDFSNLLPKMDFKIMGVKIAKAWVQSNSIVVVHMFLESFIY